VEVRSRPSNVYTLNPLLEAAQAGGYAVGSFSPRCIPLIRPILRAAQRLSSPAIVQISQRELGRYQVSLEEFAQAFYAFLREDEITVPVALHLDHTKDLNIIEAAVQHRFTSVMIDASDLPFQDNAALTSKVVALARPRGVSVEAELGKIGSTDLVETDQAEELFTDPYEARQFVGETQVDALAVSVGTSHGAYSGKQPQIDYRRIQEIRALTPVPLVLHGGSGVPAEMIRRAIGLPGGGISKVNLATDLELAFLSALGRMERLTNAECQALPPSLLAKGLLAVEGVVEEKIRDYLGSAGRAGEVLADTDDSFAI
jgi:ketose-bisphosphate aldolase